MKKFLIILNAIILPVILCACVSCANFQSSDEGHSLWFKTSNTNVVKNVDKSDADTASLNIAKAELKQYGKSEDEVELSLLSTKDKNIGDQGYTIDASDSSKIKISANTQIGLLYGTYAYIRNDKTGQLKNNVVTETPSYNNRILNH
ncbi:MAG: hypothetical protein Q4F54_03110 [Coriobacteriia bacterium]|nr:hypothetical protein [Coriobacteriia bacterium]